MIRRIFSTIVLVLTLSLSLVTATDQCSQWDEWNDQPPQFSTCIDTAGKHWYCPNHCGEDTPIGSGTTKTTIDCATECDPNPVFTAYNRGIEVDDEGGTNYPHCQNQYANEWSSPKGTVGDMDCDMTSRYYCHGHEIIVNPSLPIGLDNIWILDPTLLEEEHQITMAQTDPSIVIDSNCAISITSVVCKAYQRYDDETEVFVWRGEEVTDKNHIDLFQNTSGWFMKLPKKTEMGCPFRGAILCGESYGSYAHYMRQTNEFGFQVKKSLIDPPNPFVYAGDLTYGAQVNQTTPLWNTSTIARLFSNDPPDPCTAPGGLKNRYTLWNDSSATVPYSNSSGGVYFNTASSLSERALPLIAQAISKLTTAFFIKMDHILYTVISPMITVNIECIDANATVTKLLSAVPSYVTDFDVVSTVTNLTISTTWFTISTACPYTIEIQDTAGAKLPVAQSWVPFDYAGNEVGGNSSIFHDIVFKVMEKPNATQTFVMVVDLGQNVTAEQEFKVERLMTCGEEEYFPVDNEPASFQLNLNPGETVNLAKLSGIDNFKDWFYKSGDPDCTFVTDDVSLKQFNVKTNMFEDYTNDLISIDRQALDIDLKTDSSLNVTFNLWITRRGSSQSKEISIFICGEETVQTRGTAKTIEKLWDDDTVYNISADIVRASFTSSDTVRCPVVSYHLTYDLTEEEEPQLALYGSSLAERNSVKISLTSAEEPFVNFEFPLANTNSENTTNFFIMGCTFAKKCSEIAVDLQKISCDFATLTANQALIQKYVSAQSSDSVRKSEYVSSFISSNPKCPVTKYGILKQRGLGDPQTALYRGLIQMSSSGEVTFDDEAMLARFESSYTFHIVATTEVKKRAFKTVTVYVTFPEPVVEEIEDVKEEEVVNEEPVEEQPITEEEDLTEETEVEFKPEINLVKKEPESNSKKTEQVRAIVNPKKTVSGIFKFSPNWTPKKKKQPPPQVSNQDGKEVVVEYVPPAPPSMRGITFGSTGDVSIKFSDDIEIPSAWQQKLTFDKTRKLYGIEAARHLATGNFLKIQQQGATNGQKDELDQNNIELDSLNPKEIKFNVRLNNPALVSMSDQSFNDRLLIGFSEPILGKNGELLDTGKLPANEQGLPEPKFDIQPMVDEDSEEQKLLDSASIGVLNAGLLLLLLQFIVYLVASSNLSFFWTLINSQVNYCYLPLMSVNPPGQLSFYLGILIQIVTFDPVSMDWVSMFDFNYVSEANNVPVFSRIGMEDRNILGVLGSLFLFMLMFLVTQVIYVFLKNSRKARVVLQKIGLETSYRTLFIIFFTETYMDMLLGGLINTENFDLLYDSKNWGSQATAMTSSDQFAIILGTVIYAICMIFPFAVVILLNQTYKARFMPVYMRHHFNLLYGFLFDGIKTNTQGIKQYFSVYLLRKFLFAMLVYHYSDMKYTMMQVQANVFLSFMFLLYLAAYKPFLDRWTYRINLCNEFIMYMVSMLWITFTDFNQDAYAKVMMGWLVIFLVIANLLIPNGFILVRGLWFDTKKACCKPKRAEIKGDYYSRRFQRQRMSLLTLNKDSFRLKPELAPKEEKYDLDQALPKKNQVAPIHNFKNLGSGFADFYKQQRAGSKKTKLHQKVLDANVLKKNLNLSDIGEEEQEEVKDFEDIILSQMKRTMYDIRQANEQVIL